MLEFTKIWYSPVVICNDLAVKYETGTIMCRFMYFVLQGISFLQASVYETNCTGAKACFAYTANQPRIHGRANGALQFTSKKYIFLKRETFEQRCL